MRFVVSLVGAATLVFSPPLAAQSERTGFAVSAGVGSSTIRDEDGAETFDDNAFGFLFGVEYRFIRQFALGLNVFSLGTGEDFFDGADTEIEVRGFDIVGRIILPASDRVEVYLLGGVAGYTADLTPGGSNLFGNDATELGAGIDIDATDKFSFRLEGRHYNGVRDESGSLITLGFSYRF